MGRVIDGMKTQTDTPLLLDGSIGEGGGQILRSSLALSLVTGQPFRIERIRANRGKPGLLRQHLTAVNAAASVGHAKVEGSAIGSKALTFRPGTVVPGNYRFAVGTAGSATLVLQTILPALLTASAPSTIVLEGGTHNPLAPPFDFIEKAFLPFIERMGPRITAKLERHGFYPAGGGKFAVRIEPAQSLSTIDVLERGEIVERRARVLLAGLPTQIAERELKIVAEQLSWPAELLRVETLPGSCGPGNVILIELQSEQVTEVFAGCGKRDVAAEKIASDAAAAARDYLDSGVPIGDHLADQLLLPFALTGGGSFKTLPLSRHSQTNIEVLKRFLPISINVEEQSDRRACVVSLSKR